MKGMQSAIYYLFDILSALFFSSIPRWLFVLFFLKWNQAEIWMEEKREADTSYLNDDEVQKTLPFVFILFFLCSFHLLYSLYVCWGIFSQLPWAVLGIFIVVKDSHKENASLSYGWYSTLLTLFCRKIWVFNWTIKMNFKFWLHKLRAYIGYLKPPFWVQKCEEGVFVLSLCDSARHIGLFDVQNSADECKAPGKGRELI